MPTLETATNDEYAATPSKFPLNEPVNEPDKFGITVPLNWEEPLIIPPGIDEIFAYTICDEPLTTPLFAEIEPMMFTPYILEYLNESVPIVNALSLFGIIYIFN